MRARTDTNTEQLHWTCQIVHTSKPKNWCMVKSGNKVTTKLHSSIFRITKKKKLHSSQSYWQTQNGALRTEHTTPIKKIYKRKSVGSSQHLAPTLFHDLAIQKCRIYQPHRDSTNGSQYWLSAKMNTNTCFYIIKKLSIKKTNHDHEVTSSLKWHHAKLGLKLDMIHGVSHMHPGCLCPWHVRYRDSTNYNSWYS